MHNARCVYCSMPFDQEAWKKRLYADNGVYHEECYHKYTELLEPKRD